MSEPQVTVAKLLAMQVCVPETFTDDEIIAFAERENPAGTSNGWCISRVGDESLNGSPERVKCASKERPDCIHIVLHV